MSRGSTPGTKRIAIAKKIRFCDSNFHLHIHNCGGLFSALHKITSSAVHYLALEIAHNLIEMHEIDLSGDMIFPVKTEPNMVI